MELTSRSFRDALGMFATGVAIVTARTRIGGAAGLTINSLTSVSLEPPLVLWCLERTASAFATFAAASEFGINILPEREEPLAQRFADKGRALIEPALWTEAAAGVPRLREALAFLACRQEAVHDGGDHVVIIGRTIALEHRGEGRPLLYFRGAYRRLEDGPPGSSAGRQETRGREP